MQNNNVFSFFLNVPVLTVARESAGRLFHALRAAMLNAHSPNLSRERGTSISLLVADRSSDWDMRSDAGCSMSLPSTTTVYSQHIFRLHDVPFTVPLRP